MEEKVAISVNKSDAKPGSGARGLLIFLFIILILAVLIAGYFYILSKRKLDAFADSARNAANNSNKWGVLAELGLPSQDVAGEEIPSVTRFPTSIRTYYQKSLVIVAEYQVAETQKIVADYFKSQLAKNGWTLWEMSDSKILYLKDQNQVTITFSQKFQITTYHIEYK